MARFAGEVTPPSCVLRSPITNTDPRNLPGVGGSGQSEKASESQSENSGLHGPKSCASSDPIAKTHTKSVPRKNRLASHPPRVVGWDAPVCMSLILAVSGDRSRIYLDLAAAEILSATVASRFGLTDCGPGRTAYSLPRPLGSRFRSLDDRPTVRPWTLWMRVTCDRQIPNAPSSRSTEVLVVYAIGDRPHPAAPGEGSQRTRGILLEDASQKWSRRENVPYAPNAGRAREHLRGWGAGRCGLLGLPEPSLAP